MACRWMREPSSRRGLSGAAGRAAAPGARTRLWVFLALLLAACRSYSFPPPEAPAVGSSQEGIASWYGPGYHGSKTASGERFDQDELTAAHPSWSFGTRVRVTLLSTGRSVVVRINDRFPAHKGRIIDVSRAAARELGLIGPGTGRVRLEVIA